MTECRRNEPAKAAQKGEINMSDYFCINKSDKKIPVYSDAEKTSQIGTIYNR